MAFHLPLSATDRANKPPTYYLVVQDQLILLSSLLWTISYVLYVRQAFIDRSYGMPLLPLAADIAWEFLFGVVAPTSTAQVVAFVPWLIIDVFIVSATLQFGPQQWGNSPLVAENLGLIMAVSIGWMLLLFWAIVKTIGSELASFYIAYGVQIMVSACAVSQLLERGNTGGHSWGIWFFRATGTAATIAQFCWKYWHYPKSYTKVSQPVTIVLFATALAIDVYYPFLYYSIEQAELARLK